MWLSPPSQTIILKRHWAIELLKRRRFKARKGKGGSSVKPRLSLRHILFQNLVCIITLITGGVVPGQVWAETSQVTVLEQANAAFSKKDFPKSA